MKKQFLILLLALSMVLGACGTEANKTMPAETEGTVTAQSTESKDSVAETPESNEYAESTESTDNTESTENAESTDNTEPTEEIQITNVEETGINIGYGMEITEIGDYTGIYMEDGSDELVSGVLMCVVSNTGDSTVQYAKFQLLCGEETAEFELSTLRPGDRIVVLEKNRMKYHHDLTYSAVMAEDAGLFAEEPSLCEDRVSIQMLDGIINVTNVSDEDITGDVVVYYKNAASDLLYGGITYRVRIEGGIPAGEIRQMNAGHMTQSGSEIMFVTIG